VKKKIVAIASVVPVVLILVSLSSTSAAARKIERRVMFFAHIAWLYAERPDQDLPIPIEGIKKNELENTWHGPRPGGRLHEGQDIFAPLGTPIRSATNGYVVSISENNLGGQTVSVMGAGGRVYYYAHLAAYASNIAVGDHVTTQTLLGYVGNTGNAAGTPPHLHFGIYIRDKAVNPFPLLVDRTDD
jgi:murein DD-endopeptidase MepM/ murein hydrolase activator NlpD